MLFTCRSPAFSDRIAPLQVGRLRTRSPAIKPFKTTLQRTCTPPCAGTSSAGGLTIANSKGVALQAAASKLQNRLQAGVLAELQANRQQYDNQISNSSVGRLQQDGAILLDLKASPEGRLFGDLLWRFQPGKPEQQLPSHRFQAGDNVSISIYVANGPPSRKFSQALGNLKDLDGTVVELGAGHLSISMNNSVADQIADCRPGTRFCIVRSAIEVTATRQLEALNSLTTLQNPASKGEQILRAILLEAPQAPRLAQELPVWMKQQAWREAAGKALLQLPILNPSQQAAIAASLVRTVSLWQGPPGTGKTKTLVSYLETMCKAAAAQRGFRIGPLLAVADTNTAADNLVEGLVERGVGVVRAGLPAKVRSSLRHVTVDALAEGTVDGRQAQQYRDMAASMLQRAAEAYEEGRLNDAQYKSVRSDASRLFRQADETAEAAAARVLQRAQVVVSTCTSAGEARLQQMNFRVLLVDEASQATEPSTLIPLLKGVECLVMAGDPAQLPPTIISSKAQGLETTLFSRLAGLGVDTFLLDRQYRMHPTVAHWPSAQFYSGRVQSGVTAEDRLLVQAFPWTRVNFPVAFLSCDASDQRARAGSAFVGSTDGAGASYKNDGQADIVLVIIGEVLKDETVATVAVLTPYNGQLRLLTSLFSDQYPELLETRKVVLSTVDGFQGQEADVVIFTTVRCNPERKLGFVADKRRLNVAITRPRRALVVIGSEETLRTDPNWSDWLEWVASNNAIIND